MTRNRSREEVKGIKSISEKNRLSFNTEQHVASSSEERINNIFEKLAFLKLSGQAKEGVSTKIAEESHANGLYWIELVLSSLIATFGLLQNSVAVIIGAMLIAPLLRPIQGLAFGITTGQSSHFWRSTKLLIGSILVSVLVAYAFTLLVPLRSQTTEILARTAPNLLDLFIAIASGILALLALYYEKLSSSIAGVAMAAALMPPLAVIGIELALANWDLVGGSLLLFLTNLFAILTVGLFIFVFYGFYPHQIDTQKRTLKNALLLFAVITFISIPLFSSLVNIADRIQLQRKAEVVLRETLAASSPQAKLDQLELVEFNESSAVLSSVIKIAENEPFFLETRESIRQQLDQALDRKVTLELEIIPIASIVSIKELQEETELSIDQQIRTTLRELIMQAEQQLTVISIDVIGIEEENEAETSSEEKWAVKTVLTPPAGEAFSQNLQRSFELKLAEAFPEESLTFVWVPLSQRKASSEQSSEMAETPTDRYLRSVELEWEALISRILPEGASLEHLEVSWDLKEKDEEGKRPFDPLHITQYFVNVDLYLLEEDSRKTIVIERRMRRFAETTFSSPVQLNMRTFLYTQQGFTSEPREQEPELPEDVELNSI